MDGVRGWTKTAVAFAKSASLRKGPFWTGIGLENRLFLPRDYGLLLPILRGLVSHLNLKIDL
ncbi:hypothetical protein ASC97_22640 [Rhizobium sp. Root1203]|nr:hypothetical protein ASC97_22640 [Rhizobium sp. Root1203]